MLWVLLIVAGIFLAMIFGKVFKSKGGWRTFVLVAGIALAIYSVVGLLGSYGVLDLHAVGADKLFLASTGVGAGTGINNQTIQCPTGQSLVNGVCTVQTTSGNTFVIATLKTLAKEKNSNSYTSVGTGVQYLYIYDANTDPSSPTASYIDRINLTSGVGTDTNSVVKTNTPYRVVFNGANVWYDKDFGIMTFNSNGYNAQTGTYSFDMGEIAKIATIGAPLNGTAIDGTVNGQTSYTAITEISNASTATVLVLNKTSSDGQFYISPTISFSGAYAEVERPVLCFEFDLSNPPAGNEVSSITAQLLSGTDFGIPSELVNYWGKQQCVMLGSTVKGGTSSQVKLTFTVSTANLGGTGTDIYYMAIDDLGNLRAKDVALNTGATIQRIQFSNVA